jgi:hypothetical protein
MNDRRSFLAGLGALSLSALLPRTARAALSRVGTTPNGIPIMRAEVPVPGIFAVAQPQYQSQWCWAASIAMVFRAFGHPVSQARIVNETYGGIVNWPAGSGKVIAQALNRGWRDDAGEAFSSRVVAAYDPQFGIAAISNQQIIQSLAGNMPLVLGARGHAVVLTAVDYVATPIPQVVAAGAFDPWPGRGLRSLSPDEIVPISLGGSMQFLAEMRVF